MRSNERSIEVAPTAGDRIRNIADQLKQETSLQIKATSRILAAAAQISENHDRLIEEVVEMVEEDLTQPSTKVTVEQLKQRFKKLEDAKAHFGIKAKTWAILADRVNQTVSPASSELPVVQRLETLETEVRALRADVKQSVELLALILKKLS